ncbi:hypothetical protein H2201_005341 [Coniosporium apollinis]|uniref:GAT domain-containing protein n=1 Tax=Coniosporium apollinis TaxID=61459 RepID=A0ABQ9NWQ7_9PEZI|nr:hypothetical protein H2201_005341 [Coniosporium apollinis]
MVLKKFASNLLGKRPSQDETVQPDLDTPEANAARGVRLFCESGGPNNSTEEIQYLPEIVTAAESSPAAASAAAAQIRKFLSKENYSRPHVQYNAIMLIRILTDNPGATFTRNIDAKFTATVKELLRQGRDPSVQQILRETLFALDREKAYDTNLAQLFAMWRKEQGASSLHSTSGYGSRPGFKVPPFDPNQPPIPPSQQPDHLRPHPSRQRSGLPPPGELAGRIEEARTTAKLLLQLVQSTAPTELLTNELVKEFAERCQTAQRSITGYLNCEDPAPDDDTMLTLIETNEQLVLAATKHQRAVYNARKAAGLSSPSPVQPVSMNPNGSAPALPPVTGLGQTAYAAPPTESTYAPPPPPAGPYAPPPMPPPSMRNSLNTRAVQPREDSDNPFSDEHETRPTAATAGPGSYAHPYEPVNYGPSPSLPPRRPVQMSMEEREAMQETEAWESERVNRQQGGYRQEESRQGGHPGVQSTPSYLHRQESSTQNLTMHGGVSPPPPPPQAQREEERSPVSPVQYRY